MTKRSLYYKLDENEEPVPVQVHEWATDDLEKHIIGRDTEGNTLVSTIFLGVDHDPAGDKPMLWETMVFHGRTAEYQKRYSSAKEARKGHGEVVKKVFGEENR